MQLPTQIVFVRHAESEGNAIIREGFENHETREDAMAHILEQVQDHPDRGNWHLTDKGQTQANQLGLYLSSRFDIEQFDTIFVSGLVRAQQTLARALTGAEDVDAALALHDVIVDERLNEIPGGIFEHAHEEDMTRKPRPRGEIADGLSRIATWWDEEVFSGKHAGKKLLVFGHGAWIASCILYPAGDLRIPASVFTGNGSVGNTSLTVFTAKALQPDVPEAPCYRLVLTEFNILPT